MAAISNAVSMTQQIVPIFKGENYHFWTTKMKTLFLSNDLWDLVENDITKCDVEKLTAAQKNEMKECRKKDTKALFYIQQALEVSIFPRIMGVASSKEAWDLLKDEFQGSTKVVTLKLQTLQCEF